MTNIYFVKNQNNHVKIGRSKNIEKRLQELQTGNSKDLKILYYIENIPEHFEQHIHNISNKFHIQGEWFDIRIIEFLFKNPWFKENVKKYEQKQLYN